MKQWFTVNQQHYDQFIFFIKAKTREEAEALYKAENTPLKCKFRGIAIIDTDKKQNHQIKVSITAVYANSVDEAQQLIDEKIQKKIKGNLLHRRGILFIKNK